ncbi:MAG: 1-acyl-sn-glycerol-3-phosphate acyltransferase [Bacilli bacterium]|nr:1-acyl-sn-glycerol-3-phosphate acyltransferase [Bacilli bacterium]
MKIKYKEENFESIISYRPKNCRKPKKPSRFRRFLLKTVSKFDLKETNFKYNLGDYSSINKNEPILILMNHSSFIDLEIASTIFYPRPINIVTTTDGFIGKNWLLRNLGCVPAKKFIMDVDLVRNLLYISKKLKSSILMYPEASYSFSGETTPLPDSVGKLIKLLKIPVVSVITENAFLRQPLYNMLNKHDVDVSANVKVLIKKEDINKLSVDEINNILKKEFDLDYWKKQKEQNVIIKEGNFAEGLERVLYKCPHCGVEGEITTKGNEITCAKCGVKYIIQPNGVLKSTNAETRFSSVSEWYQYERDEVKKEILNGTYKTEFDPELFLTVDTYKLFKVKDAHPHFIHDINGFSLTDSSKDLSFKLNPQETYSVYSDFYWYELGDVISIGNTDIQYYCFPKNSKISVAKIRIASEEMYKIKTNQ